MKLKLDKSEGFNISTSIGDLFIDTIRLGVQEELISFSTDLSINEVPFFKKTLTLVAKSELSKELLSELDIDKLTLDDFDKISLSFLEHNPHLLERTNRDKTFNKNIEKPAEYLEETLREYLKKEKADWDKFIQQQNPFRDLFKNNELINNLYSNNFNISKQLDEAIKNISSQKSSFDNLQYLEPPPHPAIETNHKVQVIIDQIIAIKPVFLDSARLIKNLNDLVLEILNNFIRNTLSSTRYNRIMLIIAMGALIITTVFSLLSYFDNRDANNATKLYQQQLLENTQQFNDAQFEMNDNFAKIKEFLNKQDKLLKSNKLNSTSKIDSLLKLNKNNSDLFQK